MTPVDAKSQTTAYKPNIMDLCACRSCGDLAPDAIKEIDRLRSALVEARKFCEWPAGADGLHRALARIDEALNHV